MRTKTLTSKEDCLALMGITVWKQRGVLSPVSSPISLELLHDIDKAPYLVLVGEQGIGKTLDEPSKILLKNILKAINWPLKDCAWVEWSIPQQDNDCDGLEEQLEVLGIQKVLILGDCPCAEFNRPSCFIPSIQEMLASPQAKRLAWQRLQQYETV